jgi:hypothetical protein
MVPKDPWKFAVFSALKVPALFLVTLLVCLPALYVLNIALGWHLRFSPTAAVLMTGLASTSVMLIVLAPIVLFFTVLTDNYHFMKILNVLVFMISGAYGLQSVAIGLKGLHDVSGGDPGLIAQAVTSYRVGKLLLVWFLLYMFVGCQMAWTLRPFIGTPYLSEFAVIRTGSSNFYVNILGSLSELGDTRR